MALVAYRSAMGSQRAPAESLVSPESPRQSQESPSEAVKSIDPKERKRLRDRINVANKRAATRAATLSRDTSDVARDSRDTIGDIAEIRATPRDSAGPLSLSLKDNPGFSKERESKSRVESPLSRDESLVKGDSRDSGLMALPPDFQPNKTGVDLALKRFGEIAAADCLANFIDHFTTGDGCHERRTAARWQSRYLKWVRNERRPLAGEAQCSLPLVRQFTGGQNYGRRSLAAAADELIARADERSFEARRQLARREMASLAPDEATALRLAKLLVGLWPLGRPDNPDAFLFGLGKLLEDYPVLIGEACCDPRRGLPRTREIFPTLKAGGGLVWRSGGVEQQANRI